MKYEITAKRIQEAMDRKGLRPIELANASGVARASISHYTHGSHQPTNITATKLGAVLGVDPMWLMGFDVPMLPSAPNSEEKYYLDPETAKKAQEIYEDPNTRILLDARRNLSPEDLDIVVALVRKLKGDD